jgi:hypothetical protein
VRLAHHQVLQPGAELGPVERLGQEIVGAGVQRGEYPLVVGVGADQHHRQQGGRRLGPQLAAQLDPRLAGHPHVQQRGVDPAGEQDGHRVPRILGGDHLVPGTAQRVGEEFAVVGVVVGDEHG